MMQCTPSYHLQMCSNMGCCWNKVIRCLFSLLMAHNLYLIYRVSLIVCDTGTQALSTVVKCRIVSSLSYDIMLRIYWLRTCNPYIDWWACNLSVNIPGVYHILAGSPCNSIAQVELASLDSAYKEVGVVQLLGSHLAIRLSILMPWGHVVVFLVGSLGTPRLIIGMICILNFLVHLNHCQHHRSITLSSA